MSEAVDGNLIATGTTRPLPFQIAPQPSWAVLGDELHLAAIDAADGGAYHVAVSSEGRPSARTPLPVGPAGMVACAGRLFVVGPRIPDGRAVVVVLDRRGAVDAQLELPTEEPPRRWVAPVALGGGVVRIAWERDGEAGSALEWADWSRDGLGTKHRLTWRSRTSALAATAQDDATTLLRTHGHPSTSELVRIVGDEVVARAEVPGTAVAELASAAGRVAVLTATPQELGLRWFDSDLRADPEPVPLAAVASPAWIRSALLRPAGPDELLVGYSIAQPGGASARPSGPEGAFEDWFALYDHRAGVLGRFEPAGGLLAAGRIRDRLVIVGERGITAGLTIR